MDIDKKKKIRIETENLAVPEVHINDETKEDINSDDKKEGIIYDNLAMPEIIVKHKEKKNNSVTESENQGDKK